MLGMLWKGGEGRGSVVDILVCCGVVVGFVVGNVGKGPSIGRVVVKVEIELFSCV